MAITIQRATTNNIERLHQIERECFTTEAFDKQHIAYLLENPNAVSLAAKIDNAIAGFIIGVIHRHDEKSTGRVYTLDVAVKYRRRGVGSKLLNEIERNFVKRGVKNCCLEVRRDNMAALELYRKNGYVEREELKHYYRGAHGVLLEKELGI